MGCRVPLNVVERKEEADDFFCMVLVAGDESCTSVTALMSDAVIKQNREITHNKDNRFVLWLTLHCLFWKCASLTLTRYLGWVRQSLTWSFMACHVVWMISLLLSSRPSLQWWHCASDSQPSIVWCQGGSNDTWRCTSLTSWEGVSLFLWAAERPSRNGMVSHRCIHFIYFLFQGESAIQGANFMMKWTIDTQLVEEFLYKCQIGTETELDQACTFEYSFLFPFVALVYL